jgi:large subunit ribosomal protein L4
MIAAALRGALSDRARDGRIHVMDSIVVGETPSTKAALKALAEIAGVKLLVVLDRDEDVAWLSLRNLPTVHALAVDQLNAYDVLVSDDVVFTTAALTTLVGGPLNGSSEVTVVAVEEETVEEKAVKPKAAAKAKAAVAEKAEAPAAELKDHGKDSYRGEEPPAGFEIKGNEDSMKFHTPDSPWYGRTIAEVWFKTEKAAEKAGFVNAVHPKEETK